MDSERIKTGCKNFDNLLGGGLEPGVITNIYGESGVGKSNLSMIFALRVAEKNKNCLFIDTEGSFSPERMAQLNKDFEKLLHNIKIFEPSTFDEQHKIILDIDKHITENTKLLLVDSIVSLYRLELNNENFEEVNRKLATQLAKLSQIARKNKIAVLITTQVYSSLENKGIEIVSRDIARYWSKVLIRLERCGISKRRAIIVKHRHMPEGLEAEFFIEDKGITDKKIRIF